MEKRQIFHTEEIEINYVDNPLSRKWNVTPHPLNVPASFQRGQ